MRCKYCCGVSADDRCEDSEYGRDDPPPLRVEEDFVVRCISVFRGVAICRLLWEIVVVAAAAAVFYEAADY